MEVGALSKQRLTSFFFAGQFVETILYVYLKLDPWHAVIQIQDMLAYHVGKQF